MINGLSSNPGTCPECEQELSSRIWRRHMKAHGWRYNPELTPDTLYPPNQEKLPEASQGDALSKGEK